MTLLLGIFVSVAFPSNIESLVGHYDSPCNQRDYFSKSGKLSRTKSYKTRYLISKHDQLPGQVRLAIQSFRYKDENCQDIEMWVRWNYIGLINENGDLQYNGTFGQTVQCENKKRDAKKWSESFKDLGLGKAKNETANPIARSLGLSHCISYKGVNRYSHTMKIHWNDHGDPEELFMEGVGEDGYCSEFGTRSRENGSRIYATRANDPNKCQLVRKKLNNESDPKVCE